MKPYSVDPDRASQPTDATILRYGAPLLAVGFASSMFWYVVSRLHIGVDVSDGAYYIISYAQHRDIESQSTLAGWLWASISPFHGVLANRYLGAVFLVACFALLALDSLRIRAGGWVGPVFATAFAAAGSLVYYVHWLPDPSYNSINLGFIALGWAGLFGLLHATSERTIIRRTEIVWALVVGFAVTSSFLAKPTSAAMLGPALLVSYLASSWRYIRFRRILIVGLAALVGSGLPFVMLTAIGETPERVFITLKNGVDAGLRISTPPLNPLQPLLAYVGSTASAQILRQWFTWIAILVVAVAASDTLSSRCRLTSVARLCLCTGVAIIIPLLVWQTGLAIQSDREINGLLILMLALATGGIFLATPDRRPFLGFILGAMTISPVIYVFGTGNTWEFLVPTAAGFACAALGIVVASLPRSTQALVAIPGLGLLALLLGGSATAIEWHPYRISAPLSSLKSPARIGPLNEKFIESPAQATFYNTLADLQPIVERLPERPYLIDLSGRVPMVTFQLGAKAPRTPWLLSGYAGSTELFHLMVGEIPQGELQHAWIFQAPGYSEHFPDSILQRYGLNFPADYVPLARVPIQYLGVEGILYAPVADVKDIDLQKLKR